MGRVLDYLIIYLRNHNSKIMVALVLGCIIQIIVLVLKERGMRKVNFAEFLFILDCALIFTQTLWGRKKRMQAEYKLRPFYSHVEMIVGKDLEMAFQIIMNVAVFVPLGLLLPYCFAKLRKGQRVLGISLATSLTIELVQGIGKLGSFETDDVINNAIGTVIGFLIYKMMEKMRYEKQKTLELREAKDTRIVRNT